MVVISVMVLVAVVVLIVVVMVLVPPAMLPVVMMSITVVISVTIPVAVPVPIGIAVRGTSPAPISDTPTDQPHTPHNKMKRTNTARKPDERIAADPFSATHPSVAGRRSRRPLVEEEGGILLNFTEPPTRRHHGRRTPTALRKGK